MFWGRKQTVENLKSKFDTIVVEHRNLALERLNKNVSPSMFALFWALTVELLLRGYQNRVSESEELMIRAHAEESFLINAMVGFGAMNPDDIEEAREYFSSVLIDVKTLIDFVFSQKLSPMDALRTWSKGNNVGAEVLNDEHFGPVALICVMSIFEQSLSSS